MAQIIVNFSPFSLPRFTYMNISAVRNQLPVTESWIYLNHAAVAPLCHPSARAMRRLVTDVEENGMVNYGEWNRLYSRARRSAATLIGSRPDEIAFLKNTPDGILTVANGLRWRSGDNVVLGHREFPANVYPWLNLRDRGIEIRWVEEREGRLSLADFSAAIDDNTRVLSVSSVEFFSGFRNDLAGLSNLCQQRDIFFVVDAIQSLGVLPIDVTELGIDALAADGHKWLLAPEGCALFYCSRRALPKLKVSALGWSGVETAYDFLNYDETLYPDARRFETGTQNTVGIAGLKGSIDFLLEQGIPAIEQRILELTDRLCEGLATGGFRLLSPRGPGEKSGIVTFSHPSVEAQTLFQRLHQERIISAVRGGQLRLSPHFYNTEEEIDRALEVLSAV